jgi:Xaa-Pro aminopeptidase
MAAAPFDLRRLLGLLDENGVDVVLATSPHNVRYLLGSYSAFFDAFDAIGVDRYLPVVVISREHEPFAVASTLDRSQHEVDEPWLPIRYDRSLSAVGAARIVTDELRSRDLGRARVGLELSFAPHRFVLELAAELPGATIVDAAAALEELRAVKSERELALLRAAAEAIVDSFAATAPAMPGATKQEIVARLHAEEAARGLRFEYCLIAAGRSFNRGASPQPWQHGEVLSLDSGGRREGYIGDLCRMAYNGEPTPEAVELLAEVRAVQDAARAAVRPGATGAEIYAAAATATGDLPHGEATAFVAHGMGLVPHEAPRLSGETPIPYPPAHRERPLEPGMVLSLETDARVPQIGLVKLEDTVAVTVTGSEGYGDAHRDWIVAG